MNFKNQDVFVVGSGASLAGFDFSILKDQQVIAVNHAYKLTPHTLHTFYDSSFLQEARKDGYRWDKHTAHILAGRNTGCLASDKVTLYRRASYVTSQIKDGLYIGYSSAQAGINYALINGARNVYLLGIDCKFLTPAEVRRAAELNGNPKAADDILKGADFAHHVTQQTTEHTMNTRDKERKYTQAAPQFNVFAGRNVFNCSRFSNLQLPFKDIKDIIKPAKKFTSKLDSV